MLNAILGSKLKMGSVFVNGLRIPVTYIKAGPCVVTQVKDMDKDGYFSVQIGFGTRKLKNLTKPLQGHLKTLLKDKKAPRFLKEVRLTSASNLKVGDEVKLEDVFKVGDIIAVTGTSKGKGFAGVVKRWHFAGGPKTHGQSDRQRHPGSIGQTTTPGRVFKGKKMAGRMGGETKTVKNLHIVSLDEKEGKITISGAVPGKPGLPLLLRKIKAGRLTELVHETQQIQVPSEVPVDTDSREGETSVKENNIPVNKNPEDKI